MASEISGLPRCTGSEGGQSGGAVELPVSSSCRSERRRSSSDGNSAAAKGQKHAAAAAPRAVCRHTSNVRARSSQWRNRQATTANAKSNEQQPFFE